MPHSEEQLSPWGTATEAVSLKPVLCNKKSHHKEKPSHLKGEEPLISAERESLVQQWRANTAKNNK